MELTAENLARLKELAEKATPGPWDSYGDGTVFYIDEYDIPRDICVPENQNNSDYIAAASPDVVLALIAEIEELRAKANAQTWPAANATKLRMS